MNRPRIFHFFPILLLFTAASVKAGEHEAEDPMIERGHYLVTITGCNDCHTTGYIMSEGKTPVEEWLKGDALGWRGPWGTTYAPNLRIFAALLSEDDWVTAIKTLRRRPPMPWFTLMEMKEKDLRAVYRFIRSLGDPGEPAPAYLPPDQEPPPPYVTFPAPPPAEGE